MQSNRIPAMTEKPFKIDHLSGLYRKQLPSVPVPDEKVLTADNYCFIFIESGTGLISVEDKSYVTESGNIIFIAPGQRHLIRSADGLAVSYIYASFSTETDVVKAFSNHPLRCNASDYNYLLMALDSAVSALNTLDGTASSQSKENGKERFNSQMQVAYNCIELFLLLLSENKTAETSKETHKQTRHSNITAGVEAYLAERVRETISLQETAHHFGYSVSNIQKIFKAVTGQSIIVYFNKLKLEEAKRLIAENNMTFSQIAGYLGYSNPNYFSRIFKATIGMTPTEYANLNQKDSADSEKISSKSSRSKNSTASAKRAAKKNA